MEQLHPGRASRPLIATFVPPGDAGWGSAYGEALARFRVASLLLGAVLVPLLVRWRVAAALGFVLLWLSAGAGAGLLRSWRYTKRTVVDEPDAAGRTPWAEPWLAVPSGPLLGASAVAALFAVAGGTRGGLAALIWLTMTLALSAGFNLAASYGIAVWEHRSGARIVRPRAPVRWRGPRRGCPGSDRARRLPRRRLVIGGWAGCFVGAFVVFGFAAAGAPQVPAVYSAPGARSGIDPALSAVAARLVGGPVEVHCFTRRGWAGVQRDYDTRIDGTGSAVSREIRLPPWVCDRLLGLRSGRYRPSTRYLRLVGDLSYAVNALAHEAGHVGGLLNEAETECYAVQHTFETAVLLGAGRDYARTLAHTFRTEEYPWMPADYRSTECRPGGTLDLRVPNGWD
jgi:hypothetical protein